MDEKAANIGERNEEIEKMSAGIEMKQEDDVKLGLLCAKLMRDECESEGEQRKEEIMKQLISLFVCDDLRRIKDEKLLQTFFHMHIRLLPIDCTVEILSILIAVIKKSLINLDSFKGLLHPTLLLLKQITSSTANNNNNNCKLNEKRRLASHFLKQLTHSLIAYSVERNELQLLLQMIEEEESEEQQKESEEDEEDLLSIVRKVNLSACSSASSYFSFPGLKGSAMALPPFSHRFPSSSGFTFLTWFRIEQCATNSSPYLFSFKTDTGIGYSAHFIGNCLILTSMKLKGKGYQHCIQYQFNENQFYHLAICYCCNKWRRNASEIRVYINGELKGKTEQNWFISLQQNQQLNKCFIGGSSEYATNENHLFCGQIASLYIFNESLTPNQICAIHRLGANYKGMYQHVNENILDTHLPPTIKLRRVSTVLQVLHSLKYYYYVEREGDESDIKEKKRPTKRELITIRSYLLLFIKQLILKGGGIHSDELEAILNYLSVMNQDENIADVACLLHCLMIEHPASMIPAFDQKQGMKTIFKLMRSENEEIRIQSLKLLSCFLSRSTLKRKQDAMTPYNLFMLITEILMKFTPISLQTYFTLFEILTESELSETSAEAREDELISAAYDEDLEEDICDHEQVPSETHDSNTTRSNEMQRRIENPMILKVIATLLINGKKSDFNEENRIKKLFVSDLFRLLRGNQRENRRLVLQMSVWQNWLISLIDAKNPNAFIKSKILAIFKLLLYHAIKYEYGGWRVWIDSLAIIHAKDSYDLFDQQFYTANNNAVKQQQQKQRQQQQHQEQKEQENKQINELPVNDVNTVNGEVKQGPETQKEEKKEMEKTIEHDQAETSDMSCPKDDEDNNSVDGEDEADDDKTDLAPTRRFRKINLENDKREEQEEQETQQEQQTEQEQSSTNVEHSLVIENEGKEEKEKREDKESMNKEEEEVKEKAIPAFRIPEFRWSSLHLRLLNDLLFCIESDLNLWKNSMILSDDQGSKKDSSDEQREHQRTDQQQNSEENQIYIINAIHLVSQLSDNIIIAVGGLLPLLAYATGGQQQQQQQREQQQMNEKREQRERENNEGLSEMEANSLLYRLVNLVDVLCFACTQISFIELEAEKNMSSGGILRQCLRLICTVAVKNCLRKEAKRKAIKRKKQHGRKQQRRITATKTALSLKGGRSNKSTQLCVNEDDDDFSDDHFLPPIKDPRKLLEDIDVNRLRAVIYRDSDSDTKQSQFLALATLYFISVLMVSKYRDIIEPKDDHHAPNEEDDDEYDDDEDDEDEDEADEEEEELSAKLEKSLSSVCVILREIITDFSSFLSKTLLGSHGQELLTKEALKTFRNASSIELVMLLCSQEWQNSLQKNAGLAFIELINEGRLLSHSMKDHIVRVAMEAEFILNRLRADDVTKHEKFFQQSLELFASRRNEEQMIHSLILSAKKRDQIVFQRFKQNLEKYKHKNDANKKMRLDSWEDDSRRKRRFILDTIHDQSSSSYSSNKKHKTVDVAEKNQQQQTTYNVISTTTTTTTTTTAASNDEEDFLFDEFDDKLNSSNSANELSGNVLFTIDCYLIWLTFEIEGVLQITGNELMFEAKENKKLEEIDQNLQRYCHFLNTKINISEVRAIFSRKYFLQQNAIEIFLSQRTSILFAFGDYEQVKKVIKMLPPVGIGIKYGIEQSRSSSLMTPRELFKSSNMTLKWMKREISNFEYLMFLNTIAGRNYQDLNQYPIFPWVLTNYDSNELDLNDAKNYRDLSKPIGALNPNKASLYSTKFEEQKYHYAKTYSTQANVINYLIRLKPFTFLSDNEQISKPFKSMKELFSVALKETEEETRELIPEFFYLPELFTGLDESASTQCELPAYAKSFHHFVRLHRLALESDLVSCSLHQWIDLVFGFKQKGPEAIRAQNLFHFLSYENSFDQNQVKSVENYKEKLMLYGQIPSQLTIEPHPPRNSTLHVTPLIFNPIQDEVVQLIKFPFNASIQFISSINSLNSSQIITINSAQQFHLHKWNSKDTSSPFQLDASLFANENELIAQQQINETFSDQHSYLITIDCKHLIVAPFYDNSFRVFSTENSKLTQVIYGHNDLVTCLSRSEYNVNGDFFIVSASRDSSILLWVWNQMKSKIEGNIYNFNQCYVLPKLIISGHFHRIYSLIISSELGLIISSSINVILIHTTNEGDLISSIHVKENEDDADYIITNIVLSRELAFIVGVAKSQTANHASFLFSYNLRGQLIQKVEMKENSVSAENQLLIVTRDGEYLILNETNNVIKIVKSFDLSPLYVLNTKDSIRALSLIDYKYLLVGTENGKLIVYNIDFNRWQYLTNRKMDNRIHCNRINMSKFYAFDDKRRQLTYVDRSGILITRPSATSVHCYYRAFDRNGKSDSKLRYGDAKVLPKQLDLVAERIQFVLVKCYKNSKVVYRNTHSFPSNVARMKNSNIEATELEQVPVIILVIESLSRLNFIRSLPRTRRAFESLSSDFFYFEGITKIADNSFPNMVPLLTGLRPYHKEFPPYVNATSGPYDKLPFIWKSFEAKGYHTAFIEDHPKFTLFNYLAKGFESPPVHWYPRPFWLQIYKELGAKQHSYCYNNQPKVELFLLQVKQFLDQVHSSFFLYAFYIQVTHDDFNKAQMLDSHFANFIDEYREKLNSSLFILMGDHGNRYGAVLETNIGRIEERMPLLAMHLPRQLIERENSLSQFMRLNRQRLITWLDVHSTLLDLVHENHSPLVIEKPSAPSRHKFYSLWREEVPLSRTCRDALIPDNYCVCDNRKELEKNDTNVLKAAIAIVAAINKFLSKEKLCKQLTLYEIRSAFQILQISANTTTEENRFELVIKVKPSNGMFRAQVVQNVTANIFKQIGEISRINQYADQSRCIKSRFLRNFCFCF
ncbi:hypothetical protein B4U79_03397 [Dinothrombium tinctorium]|uniref:Neurobeachin-like protein n=1 Tax=Dinothrombium tinctorium TaxID=1965070 RepID=A0A3S3P661_9ACAR|nr:hypothetical protein B4U79_13235 [Dinothrombium tinctorium]RWS10906.1 hypothetical protein B4U79_14378 [Dinothrombium tinctorium]RWS12996.1 hypothetical protein B4U79_06864 [Dinothrombium tinctorium]RWS13005.1 hypothetical protein B4U79_03397 [Dinothrombium tinctorium]